MVPEITAHWRIPEIQLHFNMDEVEALQGNLKYKRIKKLVTTVKKKNKKKKESQLKNKFLTPKRKSRTSLWALQSKTGAWINS